MKLSIELDTPLAPLTTFGLGGPARHFLAAGDAATLAAGLAWAGERGLPVFVLGGGSNLLVADAGFPGVVVRIDTRGVDVRVEGDAAIVEAGAGEDWDALVARCVAAGHAGVECLSGIPGRVGAAPIQNIGAYGQEVGEVLEAVRAWDAEAGAVVELDRAACAFGYRTSLFKTTDRYVVLGVRLRLRAGGAPAIRYAELERALAGRAPALAEVREAVRALRRGKGMVLDADTPADDPDRRSAGSFFLNPVVPAALAADVAARAPGPVPSWPAGEGRVKLSAAWLIERAGLRKGERRGGVGLSTRHALALVNRGGTAAELVAFAAEIRRRVAAETGVTLHPEPVFVGFDRPADALLDDR
jgi:UDP-N-acetylmuramate dehydrogenase